MKQARVLELPAGFQLAAAPAPAEAPVLQKDNPEHSREIAHRVAAEARRRGARPFLASALYLAGELQAREVAQEL